MRKVQYFFEKIVRPLTILFLLPSATFAYSSSDDTLTTVLTNAVDYAQSGPARALCVDPDLFLAQGSSAVKCWD